LSGLSVEDTGELTRTLRPGLESLPGPVYYQPGLLVPPSVLWRPAIFQRFFPVLVFAQTIGLLDLIKTQSKVIHSVISRKKIFNVFTGKTSRKAFFSENIANCLSLSLLQFPYFFLNSAR
jgi:hypothetical protein